MAALGSRTIEPARAADAAYVESHARGWLQYEFDVLRPVLATCLACTRLLERASDVGGSPTGSHGFASERLTDVWAVNWRQPPPRLTVGFPHRCSRSLAALVANRGAHLHRQLLAHSSAVNVQSKSARECSLNVLSVAHWGAATPRAVHTFVRWHRSGGH